MTASPLLPATPALDLRFVRRGAESRLDRRRFRWPIVLTRSFHLDGDPPHLRTVILQSSAGALHGSDRLSQRIEVGAGAAAHVTTQGATPVHRADPGQTSVERVRLDVGEGGYLEYLPEPRILFPGAALSQRLDLVAHEGAGAIISDSFTRHCPRGSDPVPPRYSSEVALRDAEGTCLALDRQVLPAAPSGYECQAALYIVAAAPTAALQQLAADLSRDLMATAGLYGAASRLPNGAGIGLRLAAKDARALRAGLDVGWRRGRGFLFGSLPRSKRLGDACGIGPVPPDGAESASVR